MEPEEVWARAAGWAGCHHGPAQSVTLRRYRDWLIDEAIPAGGLGPGEGERVDTRHIADSILFAGPLPPAAAEVLDVGSGVGLPGIPLAISMPQTRFHLLDRSGRRARLLRRATRILGLDNVTVWEQDLEAWQQPVDGVVSRASLGPEEARRVFPRLLHRGGVAVLGGSWSSPPLVSGWERWRVPAEVLDQEVWLLIMRVT